MAELSTYPMNKVTITAAGTIHPNYCVGYDNKEIDGAGEVIKGIAMYNNANYASGDELTIVTSGIYNVVCGGTIAVGDPLSTKNDGTVVKATALSATVPSGATPVTSTSATPSMTLAGSYLPAVVIGYAVTAGSSGDTISIKLVV